MHDYGRAGEESHDGGMVMVYGTGLFLKSHYADRDDGRDYGDGERRNYGHINGQYYGQADGHCAG